MEPPDLKETLASQDLPGQWERLVLLGQKVLEGHLEKQVCLVFLAKMESLDLLENEELLVSMDLQALKAHQVWLDRQGLLENLDLLASQEYQEPLEYLASQGDLERPAKRGLLVHLDRRGAPVFQDLRVSPVSLEREDFQVCLECPVSKGRWDRQDHLDLRETKAHREYLARRVPKELKEELVRQDPQESLERRVKLVYLASQVQQDGTDYLASVGFQAFQGLKVTLERME